MSIAELKKFTVLIFITINYLTLSSANTKNFFSFSTKDIRGNDVDLSTFKGKVSLVVNTASQCSLTDSHFKSLKRLHDILSYGSKFNVIVFPSNDFGEQEPWEEAEVEEYIRGHFKAEFPIMEKTSVVGKKATELWKWIGESSQAPEWNFSKYLINREGVIVKHWGSETTIESIFSIIQSLVEEDDEKSEKYKKYEKNDDQTDAKSSPSSSDKENENENEKKGETETENRDEL